MITLTQKTLEILCTEKGGYTKATLSALGVDWPPRKGWKVGLVGRVISMGQFSDAEKGKGQPLLFQSSAERVEPLPIEAPERKADFVIKPIPTEYMGTWFRSRLEARWAMLLDDKKIRWAYEVEGYELPSGEWYLPDFWLPEIHTFLEVKGPMQQGIEKLRKFADVFEDEGWWEPSIYVFVGTETGEIFLGVDVFFKDSRVMSWGQCRECANWWIFDFHRSYTCRYCGTHDGTHHFEHWYAGYDQPLPQWKA